MSIDALFSGAFTFFASALIVVLVIALLWVIRKRLEAYYADKPTRQFTRQMIMLALSLVAVLVVIVMLPIQPGLKANLLSLLGIVISATLALSSTTIVGNAMAGFMLRIMRACKVGDYISIGTHFGRITEMDMLHTEIQTEDRDLTTLPNLYMVTNPIKVMRASGTIISVQVSLGYDVPRSKIEYALLEAASNAKLEDPFVQITELGDFSVTYRVAGLLTDIKKLLDTRRRLRAMTLDSLHAHGIEIVSPTIMQTRALQPNALLMPEATPAAPDDDIDTGIDALLFDKAEKAASVAQMREKHAELTASLAELDERIKGLTAEDGLEAAQAERTAMEGRITRLAEIINRRETQIEQEK